MNGLQTFANEEFGAVRSLMIEDMPWFVGRDVATALGYAKPQNAIKSHVDADDALNQGIIDSMGRSQPTMLINESGLYSLILSSKLPAAKRFKPRASGSIKRAHATKRHILTKRTTKNKRQLRGMTNVHDSDIASVRRMLPYA